jgi:hypothetical protein
MSSEKFLEGSDLDCNSKPYMEFIHECLVQAKETKDDELFSCAYADALLLSQLEHTFKTETARHPYE